MNSILTGLVVITQIVIDFLLIVALGDLLGFHVYLNCKGITTYDFIKERREKQEKKKYNLQMNEYSSSKSRDTKGRGEPQTVVNEIEESRRSKGYFGESPQIADNSERGTNKVFPPRHQIEMMNTQNIKSLISEESSRPVFPLKKIVELDLQLNKEENGSNDESFQYNQYAFDNRISISMSKNQQDRESKRKSGKGTTNHSVEEANEEDLSYRDENDGEQELEKNQEINSYMQESCREG